MKIKQFMEPLVNTLLGKITSSQADAFFAWSNYFLIIGLVVGLLGTIGTFYFSVIRDRFSDERIAANERLTAESNERSKKLEFESGKDKIEIERLKAINAPWDFMEGRQDLFKNELLAHPKGKILITYTSNDGIRDALRKIFKVHV